MEDNIKTAINRIVMNLSKKEGEVLPIAQIMKRAQTEGISEADVKEELAALIESGMLNKLDETAVSVNM